MENHPIDPRLTYATALSAAADDLDDALIAVRAEQDSGRISVAAACTERAELLSRHLRRLQQIRVQYLGGDVTP